MRPEHRYLWKVDCSKHIGFEKNPLQQEQGLIAGANC
jgi:hypothetical protein